jgi:hypothetical protein
MVIEPEYALQKSLHPTCPLAALTLIVLVVVLESGLKVALDVRMDLGIDLLEFLPVESFPQVVP